ncbi:hypothetical protein KP79_PYT14281 [Mizuhopecten yessoensis]|uniref:DUF6589 domain-containing protein n=1 Tax=Mizuhopecten yessoensis TaxID=6573 RepID=A0A210PN71_MIZYE|nr:hypothetical protein KP79_PYT14281 [Mizuhopecten yessoensis]
MRHNTVMCAKFCCHNVDVVDSIYGTSEHRKVHIGGDQLTRERFSGAKALRFGSFDERSKISDLNPITFELWHMAMNFLTLVFNKLFSSNSLEVGTLNGEKVRIRRNDVHQDVKNNYDVDKDFFVSFTRDYIVDALCDFFGLDNPDKEPNKNIPPVLVTSAWLQKTMNLFIDTYVLAKNNNYTTEETVVEETRMPVQVQIGQNVHSTLHVLNRQQRTIRVPVAVDHVQQYSKVTLLLGLLYMELLDCIHHPDRDRMITCMKYMMVMFKSHNSRSKYALQMLRFLCHQQASYSLKKGHESFYGLFVNTRGKKDSHIPADLQMEHIVRKTKTIIKGLGPMNTDKNLMARSKAVTALEQISNNYDNDAGSCVQKRANFKKQRDALSDERKIIDDLRGIRPFEVHPRRHHITHKHIQAPVDNIDNLQLQSWIDYHKSRLDVEFGK